MTIKNLPNHRQEDLIYKQVPRQDLLCYLLSMAPRFNNHLLLYSRFFYLSMEFKETLIPGPIVLLTATFLM